MGLYLPVRTKGTVAIGICQRCQKKFYYDELVKDPNNGMWVCKDDQDIYDPWRLPARQTENIGLDHPRPDTPVIVEGSWLDTEEGMDLLTENGKNIDVER